jgi:hypothetical protein
LDRFTAWFLGAVTLAGLVYVGGEFTPSSYGAFLEMLGAPQAGPVAGVARPIRADEWSVDTPQLQAAVRNGFRRVNQTSFYHEDLRSFIALPLRDWSLLFKPQLWAFFVLSPARAFSIYHALLLWAFLCGYYLLFRRLDMTGWLACAAALIVFFSGFTQFWWTTVGPLCGGLPWALLILLSPMAWWKKAILFAWVFPTWVFTYAYPVPLITLAWGALFLILAYQPSVLRSPGNLAAVGAGALALALVFFLYYGPLIRTMINTVYPGHRISTAGTTPMVVVLSEISPFLTFRLGDFHQFEGDNICEIGALGSFLPLLTLCLTRYRALRDHAAVRRSLAVLLSGFIAITLWEVAPVPAWIGRILLWDRGRPERWLFVSGLLLTLAALLIWSNKLISVHPLRIYIFILLGPVASLVLKVAWLIHKGEADEAIFYESLRDILICGLALAVGMAAWYVPPKWRASLLLYTVVLMNVYVFGRFNPLQPAGPIFQVPETDAVRKFRDQASTSPDGMLLDTQSLGATLNGLGFRSVSHALVSPQLAVFRSYFPAMDETRFNRIFNRIAHIQLAQIPRPDSRSADVIQVPVEVFIPVRNVRRLALGPARAGACVQPAAGGVDEAASHGNALTITGWAPWTAETDSQGIRVLSARPLRPGTLSTIRRPDVAELLFRDYGFVKSGFQLEVSSADGKPIRPEELVLFAFGTAQGEVRLACCACP